MTIAARRDPSIPQRTIPEAKVRWLGDPIGGYLYAESQGTEYAVEIRPADLEAFVAQPNEILISRRTVEDIDGSPWPTIGHHRAWPVKAGTYAGLLAKAPKPETEKPLRAWDRLAALTLMQRREPLRFVTGPPSAGLELFEALPATSEQEREALAGAVDMLNRTSPRSMLAVGGNEPPERTVAGMVAYLAQRGIELTLVRGRLLARSRTPLRADLRELIEQARELIVGHLKGQPVMCGQCAEPAVGVAFPDAPLCASHLEG
jgi:hypothetical protein